MLSQVAYGLGTVGQYIPSLALVTAEGPIRRTIEVPSFRFSDGMSMS
jgi:hypothetical protein